MTALLSIGEFSRLTHLSVKALRHYDDVGLLTPAEVDPATGYRSYAVAQVPAALVIRRFRDLDMPLENIKAVLHAGDPALRDEAVLQHLRHMEAKLEETQDAVASLRDLLEGGGSGLRVEHRVIAQAHAVAIRERVDWDDGERWLGDAFDDLYRTLERNGLRRTGPDGALYGNEFFETHYGEIVAFIPVENAASDGRASPLDVPSGEFAVTVHRGSFGEIDKTYGALGTYVTERALGRDGAIRENYVVTAAADPTDLRTEVCWPIRSTR